MSKLLLKKRRTRRRKKKATPTDLKNKAQELCERVEKNYNFLKVPEELSNEKFIPLMTRIIQGITPAEYAELATDNDLFVGSLTKLFPESKIPYSAILHHLSTPISFMDDLNVIAIWDEGKLHVYDIERRYDIYAPGTYYCSVKVVKKLPADMRKWSAAQSKIMLLHPGTKSRTSEVKDETKSVNFVTRGNLIKKIHEIRKLNLKPGPEQKKKMRKTLKVLNSTEIDLSYSENS